MPSRAIRSFTALLFATLAIGASSAEEVVGRDDLRYDVPFAPWAEDGRHLIPASAILGHDIGVRSAFPAEIHELLRVWAEQSPRAELVDYATSHEGRPLIYLVVTSPDNMARLDEIQADMQRIHDPRGLDAAEAETVIARLPAIAWMAYSIHGNETSGSDGALALAYHLMNDDSARTRELLEDTVILIDPMQNPDGRHRFLTQNAEHRGWQPSVDEQSLLHGGYWPWGRTNHYGFDLNRDWILAVHPETRGRIDAANDWNPIFMVDGHEMTAQDSYLFSPSRQPVNAFFPESMEIWANRFAGDLAGAMDDYGWRYYTGEWNESWYPGYTNGWASANGAISFLYEQARIAEDGVYRPEGRVMTYRESVHHQFISSITNLESLAANRVEILRDFLADRREAIGDSDLSAPTYVVSAAGDQQRLMRLLDLLLLQDIETYRNDAPITLGRATDQFGRNQRSVEIPSGSLIVPARQPRARLVRDLLDFDPHMSEAALVTERQDIVSGEGSGIYDTTAWNLTMLYGLPAYTVDGAVAGTRRASWQDLVAPDFTPPRIEGAVAWIIAGDDDRTPAMAARLMQQDIPVRLAQQAFDLDGVSYPRGSLVINRADVTDARRGGTVSLMTEIAMGLGVEVHTVRTGLSPGDGADLGGGEFTLLERPRVAMLSRGLTSVYDFGAIWHHMDTRLGLPSTHLDESAFFNDLRRYNVLIVPDRYVPGVADVVGDLKDWVSAGGTLILVGDSATEFMGEDGLGDVTTLSEVLESGELAAYDVAVQRAWRAAQVPDAMPSTWRRTAAPDADGPWDLESFESSDVLTRRDTWEAQFMPQGAFLAARTDQDHWLTLGVSESLPVLFANAPLLMTTGQAPVRMGVYVDGDSDSPTRVGWATLPPGHDLMLRMSGLLWPEAAARIADAAWVTRDRIGNGQVIRFATEPVFRGTTMGTARVLTNAIVYGPGMGASHPVRSH
jgi:zinc carboxypeptidase